MMRPSPPSSSAVSSGGVERATEPAASRISISEAGPSSGGGILVGGRSGASSRPERLPGEVLAPARDAPVTVGVGAEQRERRAREGHRGPGPQPRQQLPPARVGDLGDPVAPRARGKADLEGTGRAAAAGDLPGGEVGGQGPGAGVRPHQPTGERGQRPGGEQAAHEHGQGGGEQRDRVPAAALPRAAQAQAHHPQGRGRKQDELQDKPVPGALGRPLAAPELERAPAYLSRARERRHRERGHADAGGDAQRGQGDRDRHPGPELHAGERGRPDPADRECQRERHEADQRELVGGQKERLPAGGATQLGQRDLARRTLRAPAARATGVKNRRPDRRLSGRRASTRGPRPPLVAARNRGALRHCPRVTGGTDARHGERIIGSRCTK
jgi:hypothetical protein